MEQDDLDAKNLQNLHHKALMATYDHEDGYKGSRGGVFSRKTMLSSTQAHIDTRGTPINDAVRSHRRALHDASPDVAQEHLSYLLGRAHSAAESDSYNPTHNAMIKSALDHPELTDEHVASSLIDAGTINPAVRKAVTGHPRVKDSTYLSIIAGIMRLQDQNIDPAH